MSSPPKEKAETRAGHPPAVKAGGMRIVQKHPHNSDAKEEKDKDDQDWETSRIIQVQEDLESGLKSGSAMKSDQDTQGYIQHGLEKMEPTESP
ncbi:death-associated protein 1 isoform X2 [Cygnus olor]|uniref:death-associated protein 1 isoform X2 n=1 Tax=Cygnus olor TaxID=8869 RepID=UPI001ADEA2BE|nr:death-associated protein 1 isoform X2 [Cygnus olor]